MILFPSKAFVYTWLYHTVVTLHVLPNKLQEDEHYDKQVKPFVKY